MADGCLYFIHRQRSRRKEKRSDILEEKDNYTFVPNSCHGKTEMFKPISRLGRETVLLTLLVFGILLKSGKSVGCFILHAFNLCRYYEVTAFGHTCVMYLSVNYTQLCNVRHWRRVKSRTWFDQIDGIWRF